MIPVTTPTSRQTLNTDTHRTREEHRVGLYNGSDVPTDPRLVSEDSDISHINLNWREADLPQKERTKHVHGLHPYLGKFIPQIVEVFLRKYFHAGQTVFDPFVGSGTTLVQSCELGIHSVGCDISSFNVLLANSKAKIYNIEDVEKEVNDILAEARAISEPSLFKTVSKTDPEENTCNEYLQNWYAPQALRELLSFRDLIPNYRNQDILKIILSRSARSARLTTHFDLDFPKKPQTKPYYCYKHARICSPVTTAFKFLQRYGRDTVKRIRQFSHRRKDVTVRVIHEDSRFVNPGKIDGMITSPPYVGLIDYHEQHRYAYELLGLNDRSSDEIGPAFKGSSKAAKKEYQQLISEVFKNSLKYMPSGAPLIVVAGDRHNLYPTIAEMCNLKEICVIKRHVNRRTGRRSGEFYESVFVWIK